MQLRRIVLGLAVVAVAMPATAAGAVTWWPASPTGANQGASAVYLGSPCNESAAVCTTPYTINGCNNGPGNNCTTFAFRGTASQWAGVGNTSSSTYGFGEGTVYWNAERLKSTGASRAGCAYYLPSYNGSSGYRRVNAGAGWAAASFTGFGSVAAVPGTSDWGCWP